MDNLERIKELVDILNKAGKSYYQEGQELISNFKYDKLYDELLALEKETGYIMSNSPTVNVGYETVSSLPKETHALPMLSLDKTKEVNTLADFLKDKEGLISWKLDGLTVVLTYRDGKLFKAVTRGNGIEGEVITNNAKVFKNIPLQIEYKGELIVRGEAIIKYSDFKIMNEEIEAVEEKYKNPRNLCSGSVRQLNNQITAKRNVNFYCFALIKADEIDFNNSVLNQFNWLEKQGFSVVEHFTVTKDTMEERVKYFSEEIITFDLPSDGLVVVYDDIEYGKSLGSTSKFPRNGLAFKWQDEMAVTNLIDIEWSPSRTGLINPVAVFNPVELEGTTVSRASVHNLSIVEELRLGIGDEIKVYKANMIIPQIEENLTKSNNIAIPNKCPACGEDTTILNENGVKTLVCTNKSCSAKHIKLYTHFVSRNAMNIDGLSEETLKKFVEHGFIHDISDIYKLYTHKEEILSMEGFKEKSYNNLIESIEKSKEVELSKFIFSLGILNIGLSNAKMICKHFNNDLDKLFKCTREDLSNIDGVGEIIADSFVSYFENESNKKIVDRILMEITIKKENGEKSNIFEGKTFVITGSVTHFANRDEIKEKIEALGGKATGSVSAKTDYLINNDVNSTSSKNKKAKELNIPIITEEEFITLCNNK